MNELNSDLFHLNKFHGYEKKAIVIGISDYSELRTEEGKESFKDIPETMRDITIVNAGLSYLGF